MQMRNKTQRIQGILKNFSHTYAITNLLSMFVYMLYFLYRCLSLRRISFTLAYNFAKKATSFQPPKMCHLAYASLGKMRELAELISLPNTALGQILHLQKCVIRSNKALSQMRELAK